MRARSFKAAFLVIYVLLLTVFMRKQLRFTEMLKATENTLDFTQSMLERLAIEMEDVTKSKRELRQRLTTQYHQLRRLLDNSRKKFIRIKGIPEKADENLEEKIIEMASFLDISMTTNDVERANRIGVKKKNGNRVIVAQLTNYKLKQKLIRRASAASTSIEFAIQDDVTNYVIPAPDISHEGANSTKDCGSIDSVLHPVTHSKSSTVYGAWIRDPVHPDPAKSPIWVLPHFYENRIVEEYGSFRDVGRWRSQATYKLPYEWAGTGHVVYGNSLFFNKYNSSLLVKYNFGTKSVEVERSLPGAAFGNVAPYQWSGATDIDFAVDELGLWVIYATFDNGLDIVLSKVDPDNLEIIDTWRTNWRKQWCANAFMACGVMHVLKKYDEKDTFLSYLYDTRRKSYKHVKIPFRNLYEWNTMLSYNHRERRLFAWDRGYLVTYNVTLSDDKHR